MPHRPARGLAAAAVSALAVTGLAIVATPAAHAAAPEVRLISQHTGHASLRFDAPFPQGGAVRLTARVDDPGATVSFQANLDPEATAAEPGWLELTGAVPVADGYASTRWTGSTTNGTYLGGERIALRVTATNPDGTSYAVRANVEVTDSAPQHAVDITTTATGYFTQPYTTSNRTSTVIRVDGTTSATSGTVALSSWRDSSGQFTGRTTAEVEQTSFKTSGSIDSSTVSGGEFSGLLDITGFDAAAGAVAVSATRDSDDVAPVALVQQTLQSIQANGPDTVRAGETSAVVLRVLGSDGESVIGAEVRRADGTLVGYTDQYGEVVARQLGGSTTTYYANATDADAYAAGDGDVTTSDVTVPTYVPAPSYTENVLRDGAVFDRDELAAGDVVVVAVDQQGRPVGAGASVDFQLYPSGEPAPATFQTGTTNARGEVEVAVPADASGEYYLVSRLSSAPAGSETSTPFTTGQAVLALNPKADPVVGAAGGQVDYVGRLQVEGRPLPGRRVDLSYRRGVELVPGTTADAGIVTAQGLALSSRVTTNQNGTFRVTVDDVAENPQAPEIGGVLTAATGTNVASDESDLDGNAGSRDTSTTRFGTAGPGSAKLALRATSAKKRGAADVLTATGPTSLAGERVQVFRVERNGTRALVTTRRLNATGDLPRTSVRDRNGAALTTYVVQVVASQRAATSLSNKKAVR
jgi:hypothetical protein